MKRLKIVQLTQPVPLAGYSNRLNNNSAVISWDPESEVILATARARKNGKAESIVVPIAAVLFMEPLSDDELLAEMQRDEAAAAKSAAPAPVVEKGRKAALAKNDTVVMRKDKAGKIVEMTVDAAKKLDDAEDA